MQGLRAMAAVGWGVRGAITTFLGLGTEPLEMECQAWQLERWAGARRKGLWATGYSSLTLTCGHGVALRGFV